MRGTGAHFTGWCDLVGRRALPADANTLRWYLTDLEAARTETGAVAYQPATLARRLAAIAAAHRDAGHISLTQDPRVRAVLAGIRHACRPAPRRMRPLPLEDIRVLLGSMDYRGWPAGVSATRDAFVLLAGFTGALRRSELASLRIGDLTWQRTDGLYARIRSAKTDQDGGATVVLPYGEHPGTCPPCAWLRWARLLAASRQSRQALIAAVFATPAWHAWTHLCRARLRGDPAERSAGDPAGDGELDAAGLLSALPKDMPAVCGVRKGGTLAPTPISVDGLHVMINRRAATAGLAGPVGWFVTQARRSGADTRAVSRQTRPRGDAMLVPHDHAPLLGNAATTLGPVEAPTQTSGGTSGDAGGDGGGQAQASQALRSAAGGGYAGEWALFCDYTAAVGQPALPTTLAALTGFLTQVPARASTQARRVAAIAAAHRHAGYLLERPAPTGGVHGDDRRSAPASEPGQMIAACPTRGWPHGFLGRRDGFLIVLTAVLGYPHTQARRIQPTDLDIGTEPSASAVPRIRGRAVPSSDDPRTCPACAAIRWLDILGIADGLGRGSARMHLSSAQAPTPQNPHRHTLTGPPRWRHAAQLLPAIDRHGWVQDYRPPLSTRSIHTRLALATDRCANPDPANPAASRDNLRPRRPGHQMPSLEEVLTLLDQVADDADALNARIQALLASDTTRSGRDIAEQRGRPWP